MPSPQKNENKSKFIGRCVKVVMKEGKKQDKAVAICYSIWEKRKKKNNVIEILEEISKSLENISNNVK